MPDLISVRYPATSSDTVKVGRFAHIFSTRHRCSNRFSSSSAWRPLILPSYLNRLLTLLSIRIFKWRKPPRAPLADPRSQPSKHALASQRMSRYHCSPWPSIGRNRPSCLKRYGTERSTVFYGRDSHGDHADGCVYSHDILYTLFTVIFRIRKPKQED